jgi:hypothetical protein
MAEPFEVRVRRDDSQHFTVRFQVADGQGLLGLRQVGRRESEPSLRSEETELTLDQLRGARFVHILESGQRQSYAMSRIPSTLDNATAASWLALKAITEFGFRYLVLDDDAPAQAPKQTPPATASVKVAPRRGTPTGRAQVRVSTPMAPVRSAPRKATGAAVPPRPVGVDPSIAAAAIGRLNRDQAIAYLRSEMSKVEQLVRRVDDMEAELRASKRREDDLIELLKTWRDRGVER